MTTRVQFLGDAIIARISADTVNVIREYYRSGDVADIDDDVADDLIEEGRALVSTSLVTNTPFDTVVAENPRQDQYVKIRDAGSLGGGAAVDREFVVTTYRVRTAFTGASVGDIITMTRIIDVAGSPSVVSTIWRNESAAADLVAAPLAANLTLVGSDALTDAQLRATPVLVSSTALSNIDADVGQLSDAAAAADGTGNYSIISALKRGLMNWSALLARIPTLVAGRMPVDGSGVVQPARDTNGSGAVRYTTDTVAVTGGQFAQIHCLTPTVFSALTRTNGTGSLVGVSLPAGTLLIGPFTAYTLTSGAVAAYS